MEHEKIEINDETRIHIIGKLVQPHYIATVGNTIDGKTCWRKTGIAFETVSKVMVALGSILSFSSGYYHNDTLSFISGSISCLSLACLQFSSFSYKENKKQGDELNVLLKKLKLDTVPALARDDFATQMQSPEQRYRQAASSSYNTSVDTSQMRLQMQHQQELEEFAKMYDSMQREIIKIQRELHNEREKNNGQPPPRQASPVFARNRIESLVIRPPPVQQADNMSLRSYGGEVQAQAQAQQAQAQQAQAQQAQAQQAQAPADTLI